MGLIDDNATSAASSRTVDPLGMATSSSAHAAAASARARAKVAASQAVRANRVVNNIGTNSNGNGNGHTNGNTTAVAAVVMSADDTAANDELERKRSAALSIAREAAGMEDKFVAPTLDEKRGCFRCMNLLYDLFLLAVSVIDVVTDGIVCYQFFDRGLMTFFWISISIFIIAQVAYAALFVIIYAEHRKPRYQMLVFACILPFSQLVPLIIWLQAFRFEFVDRIFQCLTLDVDIQYYAPTDADPLKVYLTKKLRTLGGFLVESVVEAVPQSILQMVALVLTNEITTISLFSICISMISVASKGYVVSYSINRPTFIFNIMCFVADVFSIFTICSWLFYENQYHTHYHVFYFGQSVDIYTAIWLYKELILCCVWALFGVGFAVRLIVEEFEAGSYARTKSWRKRCRNYCFFVFFLIPFCAMIYFPFMIAIEGLKFSIFPLAVFNALDSPHGQYASFYGRLFDFLAGKDLVGKLKIANRFFANQYLSGRPVTIDQLANSRSQRQHLYTARQMISLTDHDSPKKFTLGSIREAGGYTWKGAATIYCSIVADELRWRRRHNAMRPSQVMGIIGFAYGSYIIAPLMIFSAIYSILYPLFLFFSVPWSQQQSLQQTLSLISIATLFILLMLSGRVYKWKQTTGHLIMYSLTHSVRVEWVARIRLYYQTKQQRDSMRAILLKQRVLPNVLIALCVGYLPTYEHADDDLSAMCKHQMIGQRSYRRDADLILQAKYASLNMRTVYERQAIHNGYRLDPGLPELEQDEKESYDEYGNLIARPKRGAAAAITHHVDTPIWSPSPATGHDGHSGLVLANQAAIHASRGGTGAVWEPPRNMVSVKEFQSTEYSGPEVPIAPPLTPKLVASPASAATSVASDVAAASASVTIDMPASEAIALSPMQDVAAHLVANIIDHHIALHSDDEKVGSSTPNDAATNDNNRPLSAAPPTTSNTIVTDDVTITVDTATVPSLSGSDSQRNVGNDGSGNDDIKATLLQSASWPLSISSSTPRDVHDASSDTLLLQHSAVTSSSSPSASHHNHGHDHDSHNGNTDDKGESMNGAAVAAATMVTDDNQQSLVLPSSSSSVHVAPSMTSSLPVSSSTSTLVASSSSSSIAAADDDDQVITFNFEA